MCATCGLRELYCETDTEHEGQPLVLSLRRLTLAALLMVDLESDSSSCAAADMKLNVLFWVAALFAFLPHPTDTRPSDTPSARRLPPRPLLLHLGEEFSLRLGEGGGDAQLLSSSSPSLVVNRALLQLTQRLLQAQTDQQQEEEEKGKRSDEPPISLDLTFHLLREVLEMARAEQLAQQADNNRRMMDSFGK
ncbi:corticoliberin-1-like [Parambassis ranga]|uniref:Corticoliberin-1-like n=1 Tax=Parambassis ranga TaxID=210632 RepID=A0A6P7K2I0_9TELE|nr:corticoliberin-1-like [Parambassis ranga]